ncbi:hypothetical protein EHQ12_12635 [Leptospira gomenensis]|uniref:Uncharacterized protein n=1 Tax=Leptospira gomenensis TaxID=2484974 RepID=A0A5F1YA97_9LEPT|nr:hypothetical protein [Leptospira gomenensis]TGK32776.1 hypothetical protein EHQ17_12480 [Leptospira gomenensis]TGK36924.1 hypothetical protein EHQ12_12635 [Leptospira gomenensis]TGK44395.1 hypothetical protein EHQ07_11950 [Leptospira gomenensis]TGK58888.1 hypothetical protein EHQ13_13770 [Leptospira gomenensis]
MKSNSLSTSVSSSSFQNFSFTSSELPAIVTDSEGREVTVASAIQINDPYVLLKGLTTVDSSVASGNFILDLETGLVTSFTFWPDNPSRVFAPAKIAYYVSEGSIVETDLVTGNTTTVSNQYNYW